MDPLLEVRHLKKTFATRHGPVCAVDDVSFSIDSGQTLALVGESGCGKSTVALTLLRLCAADGGTVMFENQDVDQLSSAAQRRVRQRLSIVFQNPYSSLNPKMRIVDIVGEPLRTAYGLRGRRLGEKIESLLSDVGLGPEHLRRFPHEFSGGQRQRIAIARSIALEPRLLVLDEPTAALDVSVQAQVLNLLRTLQLRLGLSYLFISHNLATVEYIADQVLVMYMGRIVEGGQVSEVFHRPRHPYTQALLDSIPSIDPARRGQLKSLRGDVASALKLPQGCAFNPRCDHTIESCRKHRPILTNIGGGTSVSCFNPLNPGAVQ